MAFFKKIKLLKTIMTEIHFNFKITEIATPKICHTAKITETKRHKIQRSKKPCPGKVPLSAISREQ